jgi:hypothetical protein
MQKAMATTFSMFSCSFPHKQETIGAASWFKRPASHRRQHSPGAQEVLAFLFSVSYFFLRYHIPRGKKAKLSSNGKANAVLPPGTRGVQDKTIKITLYKELASGHAWGSTILDLFGWTPCNIFSMLRV